MDASNCTPTRACSKCGNIYPLTSEHWHRDRTAKDGFCYACKECAKARSRQWSADNQDYAREQKRQYCAENKERIQQYRTENAEHIAEIKRAWRKENGDKVKKHKSESQKRHRASANKRSRRFYARHSERLKEERRRPEILAKRAEYDKKYYIAHRDRVLRRSREWYYANIVRARKAKRSYYTTHKEAHIHSVRLRKIRMKGAGGTHTTEDIRRQYDSQKGRCWWCGKKVGKKYHVDHNIPLARGGTNDPRNIVISCPKCNMSKGKKLPQEWIGRLL